MNTTLDVSMMNTENNSGTETIEVGLIVIISILGISDDDYDLVLSSMSSF